MEDVAAVSAGGLKDAAEIGCWRLVCTMMKLHSTRAQQETLAFGAEIVLRVRNSQSQ